MFAQQNTNNKIFIKSPLSVYLSTLLFGGSLALAGCSSDGGSSSSPSTVAVDSNVPSVMQSSEEAQGTVALVTSVPTLTSVDSTDTRIVTLSDSSSCSPKLTFDPSSLSVTVDGDAMPFNIIAPAGNCLHEVTFSGDGITTSTSTSDINVVQNAIVTVGLYNSGDEATTTVSPAGILKVLFTSPADWENVTGEQTYTVSSETSGITYGNNPCVLTAPQNSTCTVTATMPEDIELGEHIFAITKSSTSVPVDDTVLEFTVQAQGTFVYKDSENEEIDEITLTTGAEAEWYLIENTGSTTITDLAINTSDYADKFTVTDPSIETAYCGDIDELAAEAVCAFNLALSDQAGADEAYTFASTGTNASNSPIELTVNTEAGGRFVAYKGTACLQDTETGLVWYNVGNAYQNTWTNLNDLFPQDGSEAELCGQTGWRMPTLAEYGCDLAIGACSYNPGGLITGWNVVGSCDGENCASPADYLNSNSFTDVQPAIFWVYMDFPGAAAALTLSLSNGEVSFAGKDNLNFTLPVRSAW